MSDYRGKLALLSVTDKTGITAFAKSLHELGYTILSTGGTAKALREAGIAVHEVSDYTGSPEIMDGRVKTLHPKVHGAILHDRSNKEHVAQAREHGIGTIDVVAVNLYNFQKDALEKGLSREDAIEYIDVGGPTMIRAAAKNWMHTLAVIDPTDYPEVIERLKNSRDDKEFRGRLSAKVFQTVSAYDGMIASYLAGGAQPSGAELPSAQALNLSQVSPLRYGENPQQKAGLFRDQSVPARGFAATKFLQGKELSYNNILDLDAATALAFEFNTPAVAIIKHTNPCGLAVGHDGDDLSALFQKALSCDPKSAFGGIVAVNRPVDKATAEGICSLFTECVAAPEYSQEALAVFQSKPNLRVVVWSGSKDSDQTPQIRSVAGGFLVQTKDNAPIDSEDWRVVTKKQPSDREHFDLLIGMVAAKHVKSNAIVYVKDGRAIGVGAGQMSRIDSANFGAQKAREQNHDLTGAVLASDAFFPFADTVEFAKSLGISAIAQPGGSKRDQDSVDTADKLGISMVFTGQRHFKH